MPRHPDENDLIMACQRKEGIQAFCNQSRSYFWANTVVLLFILSFLIKSLSGQSAPQQLQILRLYHLLEGNIVVPLLHKCQYCMWHTGALCLSTNKNDLLATDCYFYCSRFVQYCVYQHKEVWCTGKTKY